MAQINVDGTGKPFIGIHVNDDGTAKSIGKAFENQSGELVEIWSKPLAGGIYGVEWKSDSPSPNLEWLGDAELEPTLPAGTYCVEWKSDAPSPALTRIR